ncbi:hypothetical protein DERP_005952 [Dermatophagoides pteronyssinus]|uniref:Uncharacterized protein n=1 Tax=Dermatophagoides pteronyssinus TaxID=6956 RepID=A0ABQ8JRX0_DERPT|nr:hypothetical protein DERP_005952 [Dermatophagoides pteronyssinus]
MATLTNYSTFILFFISLFIIQIELIQMYPTTTTGSMGMGNVNDGYYYDGNNNYYPSSLYPTSQSMMNQQDYYQLQQQQQYPIMTNTRRRPHIRSDVRKILVEKLSTDADHHNDDNHHQRSSSKQQQHHLCNATIISSRRLLIPNECSPNGYNRMETIQLYNPDQNQNNDTKIIQRQGRTIVRLQRSKSSLVELNETIPGTTDNDDNNVNGQFRQENFQSPPSLNEEPIYNDDNYDDLDGRQYLPIFPPMPPPPMPQPMPPIIPGYIYEYEYFEYQFCRPLHIEISICELCIWIPNVCPIMF